MLITSLGSESSDPTKEVAYSHCQIFINYYFLPKWIFFKKKIIHTWMWKLKGTTIITNLMD
jgi:hypothetical protein